MSTDPTDSEAQNEGISSAVGKVAEAPTRQRSLGKTTGQGFSWLTLSILVGKILNFVTQIVLGKILLADEFGIFAIALSIAMFIRVFNDGGVAQILVQRGKNQFSRLSGPAFWIAMSFSLAAGLLLAGIAPLAAYIYNEPKLLPLILLFAVTMPLSSPAAIFKAKLRIELRFQTIAWVSVVWFLIRYLGIILLAYQGFGVMSFVLPLPIASLFEMLAYFLATRITPWLCKFRVQEWPEILNNSFWVISAAFFRSLARNGDYMVLGLLVSKTVLGQYFFGYQLTVQIALLMATNIQYVLFPVMSHLAKEPVRLANAVVRTIRLMVLVTAPLSLLVAATIGSLESLIWNEKWAMVVPLMQVFAIAAPIRLLPEILHAAMISRGQFRRSSLLVLAEGVLLMLSAWLAVALFDSNLTQIALLIATVQMAFSVGMTIVILRGYGIRTAKVFGALLPAWLASLAAAAITIGVSTMFLTDTNLFARLIMETGLFIILSLLLARSLLSKHLDDLASVAPHPLGALFRKMLFLNPETTT